MLPTTPRSNGYAAKGYTQGVHDCCENPQLWGRVIFVNIYNHLVVTYICNLHCKIITLKLYFSDVAGWQADWKLSINVSVCYWMVLSMYFQYSPSSVPVFSHKKVHQLSHLTNMGVAETNKYDPSIQRTNFSMSGMKFLSVGENTWKYFTSSSIVVQWSSWYSCPPHLMTSTVITRSLVSSTVV